MNQLKVIKFIVFVLTFMLFSGIIFAGILLLKPNNRPQHITPETIFSLGEPDGSKIKQISPAANGLYIWLSGGNQPDRIILFDTQSLQKTFIININ